MALLPKLDYEYAERVVTDVFAGYRHKARIGDGEFYDTKNLTSAYYPLLGNRKKRARVRTMKSPGGVLAKEKLAFVEDGTLWYDGKETAVTGLAPGRKQLVSMGAVIVIFRRSRQPRGGVPLGGRGGVHPLPRGWYPLSRTG